MVEIIDITQVDFSKFNSSEEEKFNLWPIEFNANNYHTARLRYIPNNKVLFLARITNRSIHAVLEFQYNDYDTQLHGFKCGTVINIYHKPDINSIERKDSIEELFRFLQKFRKQEKIKFCFLAISNWDTILSIAAQRQGFNYMLTWGKCFYHQDKGLYLPEGYRISIQKEKSYLPALLAMTKDYFKGGRFYQDPAFDTSKTDKMYCDLITDCFDSPSYDMMILLNFQEKPVAAFISRKQTFNFSANFEVHGLRFLLSDRKKLKKGIAAPFFSETSRILSTQAALIDSGIELHNLPSLKIHIDAGYKFNFINSAYHSWI